MADSSASANTVAVGPDGDKPKDKHDEENVWQQVLAKATRRNKTKDDTTLVLLGQCA